MREKYHDVFVELGLRLIGDYCDVSGAELVNFIFNDGYLLDDKVEKLDILVEIVSCLAGSYRKLDGSIQKWFYRSRSQLRGLSPLQALTSNVPGMVERAVALAKSLRDGNGG